MWQMILRSAKLSILVILNTAVHVDLHHVLPGIE